jgi:hypothetical protein
MLKITNKAVRVLKATARSKEGASDDAGIRIRRDAVSHEDGTISVGLDVCDGPESGGDAELQQDGLHMHRRWRMPSARRTSTGAAGQEPSMQTRRR